MARAVWRGTVSFGMVSIPVKLYTATENKDVSFRQLHVEDNSPIRLVKRCAADGKDLEADEIVRGYEYAKGEYVIITDEDLQQLPVPGKQVVELSAFVPAGDIDPIYYEKSYFVEPEDVGRKPYALLASVLKERNSVAIGKVTMRSRERPCALRPRDGAIQLETLYHHDEVRSPGFDPPQVEVSESEQKVASALVDLLADDFHPEAFPDEYREAVLEMVTARLEGKEIVSAPEPEAAEPGVDLMEALKASVEAAKSKKGGGKSGGRSNTKSSEADNGASPSEADDEKPKKTRRRKATSSS